MASAAAAANTTSSLSRHYTRILKQWPKDLLRPTSAFSSLIEKRAAGVAATTTANTESLQQQSSSSSSSSSSDEMKKINALYSLLDDRYAKKWPIRADLLRPEANPNHYADLMKDIDEAPTRTQAVSWWKNVSGKIRMS